ncbi:hypothetical protein MLD38_008454 [Melastoma candidum]|uniref:Uncharacterized protein n=1 Tax=Melastoma candidum TaxID=119954 RepID=A0ACB9RU34_9MYRT|nr:hypothetical protein MLD38_008454 [Melastoma candidum]
MSPHRVILDCKLSECRGRAKKERVVVVVPRNKEGVGGFENVRYNPIFICTAIPADVSAMEDEIKSPKKKPLKQTGDLFLSCFGCGSNTTFTNKANTKGKRKVAQGRGPGPGPGLYWSIGKSTASTVPVEAAAAAIVAAAKTAVESDKSGVIRKFSQRRLEQANSAVATDGLLPPESTQERRRDEGQKPRRTDSGRKKRAPLPPPPPPPPPPNPVMVTAIIQPKPNSDNPLDPIVGMSIMLVTLIVLVSCGQLWAILCTAAWFYVLPRLRPQSTNKSMEESLEEEVDYMRSEEYKKKVVLEGILQRNPRKSSSLVM